MQVDPRTEELRQWFIDFITKFREECRHLTEAEKCKISNAENYLPPCQVEIIWIEDPEFQIVILSRFADRSDMEIIINGPFKAYQLVDVLDGILKEPRWMKPLPRDEPYGGAEKGELTITDILAGILTNAIGFIKDTVLVKRDRPSRLLGMRLTRESFVGLYAGNIGDMDKEKIIKEIIDDAKRQAQAPKIQPTEVKSAPSPLLKGCATYFYPPIVVGASPKPQSFKERLSGIYLLALQEKALEMPFKDTKVIFNRDGFMAVCIENKTTAIRIFNTILGVALLHGIPAFAVRESEIGEVNINPKEMKIEGWSMPISSLRTMLAEATWPGRIGIVMPFERRPIPPEKLIEIVSKAGQSFDDANKVESLIFGLEAYTHFNESEFAQAFTMGWIVIERRMFELWESFLKEKNIGGKRKDKLTNPILWSIDYVLETLNLNGVLGDNEYTLLNDLKNKRNNFIHKGQAVTSDDAMKCLNVCLNIVKSSLSSLMKLPAS